MPGEVVLNGASGHAQMSWKLLWPSGVDVDDLSGAMPESNSHSWDRAECVCIFSANKLCSFPAHRFPRSVRVWPVSLILAALLLPCW